MLFNIQALRAVAALLVVVVHLELLGEPMRLSPAFFHVFAVGVDLFFVISGFIMVHTTSRRPISPVAFLQNRLIRIAPLYWLLTCGVFALALAWPRALGGTQADWAALAKSLTFVPYERADGTMRPILFVGWSLNLEMAFYAMFAAVLTVAGRGQRVLLGGILLIAAVTIGRLAGAQLSPELRFLTQPLLLEFCAGMAIGWLYPKLPASASLARYAIAVGMLALAGLVLAARWPVPGGWPLALLPASVAVLAALVAENGGVTLRYVWLQNLGNASYALYLVHPFVTQAWTLAAVGSGLLAPDTAWLFMLAAFGSAVAAGLLLHILVEKPLGRLLHGRAKGESVGRLTGRHSLAASGRAG